MADPQDDLLMREIEEELRQEQAKKLWSQYGKYIIGVAALVVLVVAGYQGWQAYDRSERQTATDRLIGAGNTVLQGDAETALESYGRVAAESPAGIALMAKFRRAGLLAQQGDHAGAEIVYAEIAGDTGISPALKDLAMVLGAAQALDARPDDAQSVIDRLQPLTAADQPWRHSAREVAAMAALESGQRDRAIDFLQSIVLDPAAPDGLRGRAQQVLQVIGE